jgi:hypothetical protein
MSFTEDNKDALRILADKIRELDTVRDCDTVKEMQARKYAINMVEGWIEELFGIKKKEFEEFIQEEEDNIVQISEQRSNSEDN